MSTPAPAPRNVSGRVTSPSCSFVSRLRKVSGPVAVAHKAPDLDPVGSERSGEPAADEAGRPCHECFHHAALWHPAARDLPGSRRAAPRPARARRRATAPTTSRRWPSPSPPPRASRRTTRGRSRPSPTSGAGASGTFSEPTYVTAPPGDRRRLFVVEQGGTIRVVHRGRKLARPYLDIRGRVQAGGERGLLSMAFAPNYRENRRFYVYYTDNGGDIRVVEFKGRRNRARKRSARTVLRAGPQHVRQPQRRPAPVRPRRLPLHRHGRRRRRRRSLRVGPGPRHAPRARSCGSARTASRASRARTRSAAVAARGRPSTRTACATRGGSRSTARPATS